VLYRNQQHFGKGTLESINDSKGFIFVQESIHSNGEVLQWLFAHWK